MTRHNASPIRASSRARVHQLRAAITLVLIALASSTSLAVTRSWDGGGGADTAWTTGANWSSNTEPGISDAAQFDRGPLFNYTVTFPVLFPVPGDITTDRLIVGSNTVTFEPDHSTTKYIAGTATDELGRGIIIGEEANDTAAVLTSHLGVISTAAATLGHVAGSSGTLTLNQNNDQFNVTGSSAADTELIIGRYGTGVLNVSGGADVNVSGELGNIALGQYTGSVGTASISGTGSIWSIENSLSVGVAGTGTLNVTAGDVVSATGILGGGSTGNGSVTVTGNVSRWSNSGNVYVGGSSVIDGGNGTLSITNQGLVDIDGTLKLWPGGNVSLNGGTLETANIELAGGTLNWTAGKIRLTSDLNVESTGPLGATLIVGPGKTLQTYDAYIGHVADSNGAVTVDGPNAFWGNFDEFLLAYELYVGYEGTGTLSIINGGSVVFGDPNTPTPAAVYIGKGVGSMGTVLVAGEGSKMIGANGVLDILAVGGNGLGTLNISSGATVGSRSASIGDAASSPGAVTLDGMGSMWVNAETIFFENGTLTVTNGGKILSTDSLHIYPLGTVNGNGTLASNLVTNDGVMAPGSSPSALNIEGNYIQSSQGNLQIELASASSYDQLLVTGTATLGGTLTISLVDGFQPTYGQSFAILTAGGITGTFTTKILPPVPNLAFDVIYNPQSVVLTVLSALPGDYNGNGAVDAADYVTWRKNEIANSSLPNDYGLTNQAARYALWRANFGNPPDAGSSTAIPSAAQMSPAVPEPATVMLLILAAAGSLIKRNRVRGKSGQSDDFALPMGRFGGNTYVTHDEPLFGLGCQESVRDLVPFFLALLTRFLFGSRVHVPRWPRQCQFAAQTGVGEVTRIESAFGLRVRFSLAVTSCQADCWRDALKPLSDGRPRPAWSWPRQWHERQHGRP